MIEDGVVARDAIVNTLQGGDYGKAVGEVEAAADSVQASESELRALDPPEAAAEKHDELVAEVGKFADQMEAITAAGLKRDAQAIFEELGITSDSISNLSDEVMRLATDDSP